jgi:hypothetical protein
MTTWQPSASTNNALPFTQYPPDGVVPRLCYAGNQTLIAWGGAQNTIAMIQLFGGVQTFNGLSENDGFDFIDFALRASTGTILCLSTSGVVYEFDPNAQTFSRYAPFESLYGTAPVTAIERGFDQNSDEIWFGWNFSACYMGQDGNITAEISTGSGSPVTRIRRGVNGFVVGCTADTYFYAQYEALTFYPMSGDFDILVDVCILASDQFGPQVDGVVFAGVQGGNGRAYWAPFDSPNSPTDFQTGFFPNLPMISVGNLAQGSTDPNDTEFALYMNNFGIYMAQPSVPGVIAGAVAFDSPPSNYGANYVVYGDDEGDFVTYGQTVAFGQNYIWRADSQNIVPTFPPMDPPGLTENDLDIVVTWPQYNPFSPDGYLISRTDVTANLFSTISTDANTFEYVDDQCVDGHTYSYTIHAFQNNSTQSPESDPNSLLFFLTPELRIDVFYPPNEPIISLLLPLTPIDSHLPDNGWQIAVAPPGSETRIDFNDGIYSVRNLAYGHTTVRAVTDSSPFKVQDIHYHVQESPAG